MKKSLTFFEAIAAIALIVVIGLTMTGCETEDTPQTDPPVVIATNPSIEGNTLVHYAPELTGVNHFGNNLGTNNDDGSYTFNGTAAAWAGGGAQYTFPLPGPDDTWNISDYQVVEVHLKVTSGSVTAAVKKFGNNIDLKPYPTDGSNSITFNVATNGGKFTYKTVIDEAGYGIGLQRNTGGPATVAIEKVVFSKVAMHTINFDGGENASLLLNSIIIPTGRTVNFGGNYAMPDRPRWTGHTFTGWKTAAGAVFNPSTPITADVDLVAQWEDGDPEPVDMSLNLDPSSWGTLPANAALTAGSGWTIPSAYATTSYSNDVLTITFSGDNRQRAIIPLSSEQIDELIYTQETGVTFRIVGTVSVGDAPSLIAASEFRCHLANPAATGSWNGTDTGAETALENHLVEYRPFSTNKSAATLGYFAIQAMYKGTQPDANTQFGFQQVTLTIESITIDIGDTRP